MNAFHIWWTWSIRASQFKMPHSSEIFVPILIQMKLISMISNIFNRFQEVIKDYYINLDSIVQFCKLIVLTEFSIRFLSWSVCFQNFKIKVYSFSNIYPQNVCFSFPLNKLKPARKWKIIKAFPYLHPWWKNK